MWHCPCHCLNYATIAVLEFELRLVIKVTVSEVVIATATVVTKAATTVVNFEIKIQAKVEALIIKAKRIMAEAGLCQKRVIVHQAVGLTWIKDSITIIVNWTIVVTVVNYSLLVKEAVIKQRIIIEVNYSLTEVSKYLIIREVLNSN